MAEKKHLVTDTEMDGLFAALRDKERAEASSESRSFLNSLAHIPQQHSQEHIEGQTSAQTVNTGRFVRRFIERFIERWFLPEQLLSARGLVAQVAFASLLLVSGIVTGLEVADEPQMFDDYDVSASLFGVEDADYSIDG